LYLQTLGFVPPQLKTHCGVFFFVTPRQPAENTKQHSLQIFSQALRTISCCSFFAGGETIFGVRMPKKVSPPSLFSDI
jgi:hypothetical protein